MRSVPVVTQPEGESWAVSGSCVEAGSWDEVWRRAVKEEAVAQALWAELWAGILLRTLVSLWVVAKA